VRQLMKAHISSTGSSAHSRVYLRAVAVVGLIVIIATLSTKPNADTGTCGDASITLPFTDVSSGNIFFCSIAEAFFSGLTNGTDASHYSPSANVPREQMAAFVTRTLDQSVKRASKRAALQQFWTILGASGLGLTTLGTFPYFVQSDGADLWVAGSGDGVLFRVRASDGKLLGVWTGATSATGVLCAESKVFITGEALYQIDPAQPQGPVTTVTSSFGSSPFTLTFDGQRVWTTNTGSVSIVTLSPVSVTTASAGFIAPAGILFDGFNIWVTDDGDDSIKRLDSNGNIILSVNTGARPRFPAFDGTNLWVPNGNDNSISVVRATGPLTGTVLATLTGNGLSTPTQAAFDGESILVTNFDDRVSLWKASDLTPIGAFSTGTNTASIGACSNGVNFWITLYFNGKLARF